MGAAAVNEQRMAAPQKTFIPSPDDALPGFFDPDRVNRDDG